MVDNDTSGHEQITTEDWAMKSFGVTSRAGKFAGIWGNLKQMFGRHPDAAEDRSVAAEDSECRSGGRQRPADSEAIFKHG